MVPFTGRSGLAFKITVPLQGEAHGSPGCLSRLARREPALV